MKPTNQLKSENLIHLLFFNPMCIGSNDYNRNNVIMTEILTNEYINVNDSRNKEVYRPELEDRPQ